MESVPLLAVALAAHWSVLVDSPAMKGEMRQLICNNQKFKQITSNDEGDELSFFPQVDDDTTNDDSTNDDATPSQAFSFYLQCVASVSLSDFI